MSQLPVQAMDVTKIQSSVSEGFSSLAPGLMPSGQEGMGGDFSRMMDAQRAQFDSASRTEGMVAGQSVQVSSLGGSAGSIPPPAKINAAAKGGAGHAMGERILDSMDSVGKQFGDLIEKVGLSTEGSAAQQGRIYAVSDILKLQVELVKVSVTSDMMAKGTNQVSKSINELTHLQ